MSMSRACAAAVLVMTLAVATAALHAQAPALANSDVIRLVMTNVSDQTVIAVIHEATSTQFDLSPRAVGELGAYGVSAPVIAAMRQPSLPPGRIAVLEPSPAGRPPTLADAAAEAAKIKHEWTLSANTGPLTPPVTLPAGAASPPVVTGPASGPTARAVDNGVDTEAYWKARMSALRARLTRATPVRVSRAALVVRLEAIRDSVPGGGFGDTQAYAVVSTELAKARADLGTAAAEEDAAKAAISAAEEEARRLGIVPGWLRP